MRIALTLAILLASLSQAQAGKSVTFHSGAKCVKPDSFNLAEWKNLKHMVKSIERIDRKNNVWALGMSRSDFDAGKRWVSIEFDCASLKHLKPDGDRGRKRAILGLLGNEARDPGIVAKQNDITAEFKAGIKKIVIGAHASNKKRDMRVTLNNRELKISRVSFGSGGGWTPGEYNKFLENNL